MKITFQELSPDIMRSPALSAGSAIVLLVGDDRKLSPSAQDLDKATGGMLKKALNHTHFKGKKGQFFSFAAPPALDCARIAFAGTGKGELSRLEAERLGGGLVAHLHNVAAKKAALIVELPKTAKAKPAQLAAHIAVGARLRNWRFDKYLTREKSENKPTFAELSLLAPGAAEAKKYYASLEKVAEGALFTRDIVSEPANIINPETLAAKCRELTKFGIKVEVLGEKEMKRLGMGALLGVGQGSVKESQLVVMQWQGNAKDKKPPLAFVGKGVCFDTGGISIKPANSMEEMKWDMAGAGAVIGLMIALAGRKAKVNVVGVVGLVENMPDGNAQRPGDVVKSMSGQTIEVINTDAEGRLVLADALWYTQDRFKPRFMIDLATLTGAIIIALGHEKAGLYSNDDVLARQLAEAGERVGEPLWRMPLGRDYDRHIKSAIADMQNVGENRSAGSISAAAFLQRFINKTKWAHLDIAGTAWAYRDQDLCPKGASAFGVRLLDELVKRNYE